MEDYLDRLESQFGALASRIMQLEDIEDQPVKFGDLDKELVAHISHIRKQYDACKQIESLQNEGQRLDNCINSILIELDNYRKQLEKLPPSRLSKRTQKVDSQMLLDYATKITRFTRQIPGTVDPSILPWPTEDWLRRGMLATLTIQDEQQAQGEPDEPVQHETHTDATEKGQPEQHAEPGGTSEEQSESSAPKPSTEHVRAARKPKQKISLDFDSDDD